VQDSGSSSSSSATKVSSNPLLFWLHWRHRQAEAAATNAYLTHVLGAGHMRVDANESNLVIPGDVDAHWGQRTCMHSSAELKEVKEHGSTGVGGGKNKGGGSSSSSSSSSSSKDNTSKGKQHKKAQSKGGTKSASDSPSSSAGDKNNYPVYAFQERINPQQATVAAAAARAAGGDGGGVNKTIVKQFSLSEFRRFNDVKDILRSGTPVPVVAATPFPSTVQPTTAALYQGEGEEKEEEEEFPLRVVSGLCGRGKGHNALSDLSVLIGHLTALYKATVTHSSSSSSSSSSSEPAASIESHQSLSSWTIPGSTSTTSHAAPVLSSSSEYAVILDDDVHLPFDIDFELLAKSAPADFGILRLMQGSDGAIEKHFQRYVRNHSLLWIEDRTDRHYDAVAATAYVIHKARVGAVLQHMVRPINLLRDPKIGPQRALDFKVLAGLHSPCIPLECCGTAAAAAANGSTAASLSTSSTSSFRAMSPCVDSKKGFQAERFLFRMGLPTYVLTVPLVVNRRYINATANANANTTAAAAVDPEQVALHNAAKMQIKCMNEFLIEKVALPAFASIGCVEYINS
jgi:hypothetical protein